MEKNKYYVSVQAGTVMYNQGDAVYELEIEATPDEVEQLMQLMAQRNSYDYSTFWRAHIPVIPYHLDKENDNYDNTMLEVYDMIHKLGTEETKRHIESMNLHFIDTQDNR